MEGALEGAAACCTWKLACSLLALAWLPPPRGPVGCCCCCLLLFTDFAVTAFLALLCASKSWPGEPTPRGDAVALRLLLSLGRLYAAALLLTCPLMALEALARLRRSGGAARLPREARRGLGFLCCLAAWVLVALDARRRRVAEESRAAACLRAGESLLACLPGIPPSSCTCSCLAFLLLLLLLLLTVDQNRAPPQTAFIRGPASISAEQVPAGQEQEGTKGAGAPASVIRGERGRRGAAPPPGTSALMAGVGVACVLTLPLILSVNVVLVRAVDQLLELSLRAALGPPPADERGGAACHRRPWGSGFSRVGNNLEIC